MTTIIILTLIIWLACGIVAAGWLLPFFLHAYSPPHHAKEDYREVLGASLGLGLIGGPMALFVAFFITGFGQYGWWRRPSDK
jgi:hypothetical protein